jgi:hypothetical protein
VVRWVTGESATSTVVYGLTNEVTRKTSATGYSDQHRVLLTGLESGQTYYFYVISEDRAGNATTNTLDGAYYRFVAPSPASAPAGVYPGIPVCGRRAAFGFPLSGH